MSIQKSIISIDEKIVGTNLRFVYGLDLKQCMCPCVELSKKGLPSCVIYLHEWEALIRDKIVLQKVCELQNANRVVFSYSNLKIIFFKARNKNGYRVKLISTSDCYIHSSTYGKHMRIIVSSEELLAILRHSKVVQNLFCKYSLLASHMQKDFETRIREVRSFKLFDKNMFQCKIAEYCNDMTLVNVCKLTKKKFVILVGSYRKILPMIFFNFVTDG
jgi:hypothetical protein